MPDLNNKVLINLFYQFNNRCPGRNKKAESQVMRLHNLILKNVLVYTLFLRRFRETITRTVKYNIFERQLK